MGDGAFSNVYKAIERKTGRKCAVKVVRKFELNHSQVRLDLCSPSSSIIITCAYKSPPLSSPTPWPGWDSKRQSFTSFFFFSSFCFVFFLLYQSQSDSLGLLAEGVTFDEQGLNSGLTGVFGRTTNISTKSLRRGRGSQRLVNISLYPFIPHLVVPPPCTTKSRSLALERREFCLPASLTSHLLLAFLDRIVCLAATTPPTLTSAVLDVDNVLTGLASQHPQRGPDHARYRPPWYRETRQLLRER